MYVVKNPDHDIESMVNQPKPDQNLMRDHERMSMHGPELQYLDRISRQKAMDWLYERHIVFDLLPEHRRVEQIAADSVSRVQALGALDYLEEGTEKEDTGILGPFFVLFTFIIGLLLGVGSGATGEENDNPPESQSNMAPPPLSQEAYEQKIANNSVTQSQTDDNYLDNQGLIIVVVVIGALAMMFVMVMLSNKNRRAKRVAAWAKSWGTAIREYEDPKNLATRKPGGCAAIDLRRLMNIVKPTKKSSSHS